MSLSYLMGNLLGCAIISFLLLWLVCLVAGRFDWRLAFSRSRRWYRLLTGVALSLLGMEWAMIKAEGLR